MVGVIGEYGGWTGEAEREEGEVVPFRGIWVCWEEVLELGGLVESVREGMLREELEVGGVVVMRFMIGRGNVGRISDATSLTLV
jgi:hypothetical protein